MIAEAEAANSAATEVDQPALKAQTPIVPKKAAAPVAKPVAAPSPPAPSKDQDTSELPPDIQEKLQFDQDKKSAIDEGYTEDQAEQYAR